MTDLLEVFLVGVFVGAGMVAACWFGFGSERRKQRDAEEVIKRGHLQHWEERS